MRIVKPAAKVLLFSDIRKQYKHLFAYSDFILYLCTGFVPTVSGQIADDNIQLTYY